MLLIKDLQNYNKQKPLVLTIGTFDGVHLGHQKIISHVVAVAKSKDLTPALLTFESHPRILLGKDVSKLKLLSNNAEKVELLNQFGIETIFMPAFTQEFAAQEPEDFVRLLTEQLGVKHMVIGYDHKFGKNRAGNMDYLRSVSEEFDFEVEEIPAQDIDTLTISSTQIRNALLEGDLQKANKLLGYEYFLSGFVAKGNQIGRAIGFPTANLALSDQSKLVPAPGIYAVKIDLESQKNLFGMMYIGTRPTIKDQSEHRIEINIFDFEGDIYGQEIRVAIFHKTRDDAAFNNLEELASALQSDKIAVQNYFKLP